MHKQKPFSRFLGMMSMMSAMISEGVTRSAAMSLSGMGDYKSRGKGRGGRQSSNNTNAQLQRASIKARNRAKHKARA